MTSVDPSMVRALVRRALEQKLGLAPTPPRQTTLTPALSLRERGATIARVSVHPSQLAVAEGPASSAYSDCYEDMDLPLQTPCLIEPHRPCYNSGYCRKLGH